MEEKNEVECALKLHKLVFDKIHFDRSGFKNDKEIEWSIKVQIGEDSKNNIYKVTVCLSGNKEKEYEIVVQLSGFFSTIDVCKFSSELIKTNTVAIMMPYIRSQISLLTAQPDTECVVLPPMNVGAMMKEDKETK